MPFGPTFTTVSVPRPSAGPGRVLLLSTDMGMGGGAEEQVLALASGLKARGWGVLIVSMLPPKPLPPGFEAEVIGLTHLGMRAGFADPRAVPRLARLVREFRPDVVHSHMVHANLLARAVRLVAPYPALVCTHHNLTMAGVQRDRTALFELAHRVTDGLAEHATAICHAASDYYVRRGAVPASKITVMPNGIETQRFRPDPAVRARLRASLGIEGQFVWLAVGRLERAKAYPTMLHAFARLGDGPRSLLICGQGSLREELESLARSLEIAQRVRFLGLRDDVPAVMSAADALALSSDLEGLPLVLLQASAAGLPIVATTVGGNAEVVVEGTTGYLVPPSDPAAFAHSLARVEAMPEADRLALGRAGQARMRDLFETERVIDRWERLYLGLMAAEGGGAVPPRRRARFVAANLGSA